MLKNTLLRVIPTMTFIHVLTGTSSGILSDISSDILFGILSGISSGISSGILSGKSSGILSGISSGILSDISYGILSGILSGISSGIYSDISSGILSGISSGISIWHIFWHIFWHSTWQIFWHYLTFYLPTWDPAGNTWRGYSRLRSGREHWAWMVVVEVRQGTLGGDGRGWGPAGNTGRGYSRLRSGREHWAWMVVVEVRQGTLGVDGRGWGPTENTVDCESQLSRRTRRTTRGGGQREEEDQATDIKSNNPHLAGGEKTLTFQDIWYKGAELSCNPCSQEFGACSGLSGGYCHEALHREQPKDFAWPGCQGVAGVDVAFVMHLFQLSLELWMSFILHYLPISFNSHLLDGWWWLGVGSYPAVNGWWWLVSCFISAMDAM